jgi:nitroreductase/NAD-dependent dihydropyrimidine dehydrogenase PreA subunit
VVTVDLGRCTGCGICLKRFGGYCLRETDGKPEIDYGVCNMCQKCVAICPQRAFLMNGVLPRKRDDRPGLDPAAFEAFLVRRRSIKKFEKRPVPRRLLERIARAAAWAPNQNKNLMIHIIDDRELLRRVDREVFRFTRRGHRLLYTPNPVALLARLFMGQRQYRLLKRKMERRLRKKEDNPEIEPQALIMVYGNPRIPVTAPSAPFLLSNMLLEAECLGVGSTLLDSVKHALNLSSALKKTLGLPRGFKVFGVLALGYSDEKIVNIPRGYEVEIAWNSAGTASQS